MVIICHWATKNARPECEILRKETCPGRHGDEGRSRGVLESRSHFATDKADLNEVDILCTCLEIHSVARCERRVIVIAEQVWWVEL